MPLSSRVLLSPLLLLIIAGSTGAFSSRQGECSFPARWEGSWFQSGVRQSIQIFKNELSTKGKCLHNEGDKFLLVDQKSCYRCVVIHEKHSNVLQYKETYCHSRNSLASLCSYITGDALLYSMFREEAPSVPCPFRGPMTFEYNRGHGTCSNPPSNVDTCTDDSRLLFKYQACPDVSASESAVEELECLATWKEGSSRYLVGRLHHGHASSNEDRYRCFVYEKAGQTVQGNLNNRAALGMGAMDHEVVLPGGPVPEGTAEVYRVAQSGDATCNGLFSPMEGSRTMTLRKISSPGECRFPNWLTGHSSGGLTWHTLDLGRSYTFHPRNASLHVARSNMSTPSFENGLDLYVPGSEDQDVKILCNSIKQANVAQTMTMTMLVAHFTIGCRSGFRCMTFYRRDGHVIELQTGNVVPRPEEACSPPHFVQTSTPFLTLVTSSPEPRTCPYLGKFTVTDVNRNQRNTRESRRSQHQQESLIIHRDGEKVRHAQERNEDRRGRKLDYEVEKRRANNEYLIHERMGRRARSNHGGNRSRKDYSLEEFSASRRSSELEETFRDLRKRALRSKTRRTDDPTEHRAENLRSRTRRSRAVERPEKRSQDTRYARDLGTIGSKDEVNSRNKTNRTRRHPKIEDFHSDDVDAIEWPWAADPDDTWTSSTQQVQDDYFGDYLEAENPPQKRFAPAISAGRGMTYKDLLRIKRELEERETDEDTPERREKRNENDSRCNSEVTTLTVGCSTADRMEFQSDCVDDDAITAYSCHGRWFDAEGTQFVIATPLGSARRTAWSSSENNRAQPYRNSRRLCFMYKESGGVVSLTASPIACQRGIPPPAPMLAFNATSTGQCMEANGGQIGRSMYLTIVLLTAVAAIFR
ncbi:uncharacterized protein [Linepithema humile]|uniref:uncharacterized protein n=1 Tax=Linepithema humile TaxID=83485 RepID=UPI0006233C46|nr:PREDICTED: uncharacterized protein LOC105671805 [Linepithema humile]